MNEAFVRMEALLGREAMDKLAQSHVAVWVWAAWAAGPPKRCAAPVWAR